MRDYLKLVATNFMFSFLITSMIGSYWFLLCNTVELRQEVQKLRIEMDAHFKGSSK